MKTPSGFIRTLFWNVIVIFLTNCLKKNPQRVFRTQLRFHGDKVRISPFPFCHKVYQIFAFHASPQRVKFLTILLTLLP